MCLSIYVDRNPQLQSILQRSLLLISLFSHMYYANTNPNPTPNSTAGMLQVSEIESQIYAVAQSMQSIYRKIQIEVCWCVTNLTCGSLSEIHQLLSTAYHTVAPTPAASFTCPSGHGHHQGNGNCATVINLVNAIEDILSVHIGRLICTDAGAIENENAKPVVDSCNHAECPCFKKLSNNVSVQHKEDLLEIVLWTIGKW